MKFDLLATDNATQARAGLLHTPHGVIETPIFMPVGTVGSVKSVTQHDLWNRIKAPIILGNTYHLFLRPGNDTLHQVGGLHKFINWPGAMLTDSGGYQVFSLANSRKITEEGAAFQSHIDGSKIMFTPENVVDTQRIIGADIIMAFDECPPYPAEKKYVENSMHLTHRWLDRCLVQMANTQPLHGHQQALFPIVQGGTFPDLRVQSAEYMAAKDTYGIAIGGLSVGEPTEDMYSMTSLVCDILPKAKPRYLMGVGKPENIIECIARGIDMFDCVMPTRNARHGYIFTTQGVVNIKNEKWKNDFTPLDPLLTPEYSMAYTKHLLMSSEYLGFIIASVQNLSFYLWLVSEARMHILDGDFARWKEQILPIVTRRF